MSILSRNTKTVHPRGPRSWNHMKQGLANWSRRARSHKELMNLSDRCLNDIGIERHSTGLKSCKPFWMA